jgi:hypothetical protein
MPFCPGFRVSGLALRERCSGRLSNSILTGSFDGFITCMTLIFFSVFFTLVKARWLLSNLTEPTGKI